MNISLSSEFPLTKKGWLRLLSDHDDIMNRRGGEFCPIPIIKALCDCNLYYGDLVKERELMRERARDDSSYYRREVEALSQDIAYLNREIKKLMNGGEVLLSQPSLWDRVCYLFKGELSIHRSTHFDSLLLRAILVDLLSIKTKIRNYMEEIDEMLVTIRNSDDMFAMGRTLTYLVFDEKPPQGEDDLKKFSAPFLSLDESKEELLRVSDVLRRLSWSIPDLLSEINASSPNH